MARKQSGSSLSRKAAKASLLLGLFLFVLALSGSESLHQCFHKDACSPGHHCVVDLIVGGQVDLSSTDVSVPPQPVVPIAEAAPVALLLSAVDYSLLPSRGPPTLSC